MLETTQGSSPKNPNSSLNASNKSGVDLTPFIISPSMVLWRLELAVYCGLLCAVSVALFPFFFSAFYWPVVWLAFCGLVVLELRKAWRIKHSAPIGLSIKKDVWQLNLASGAQVVEIFDEILLWPAVIILPVREIQSGRKRRILVLPDSVRKEDWRRLRVWLRTGLRNNN